MHVHDTTQLMLCGAQSVLKDFMVTCQGCLFIQTVTDSCYSKSLLNRARINK